MYERSELSAFCITSPKSVVIQPDLISSLAEDEGITELKPDATYRIWSPYDSHDAAHKLAQLLEEEQTTNNV